MDIAYVSTKYFYLEFLLDKYYFYSLIVIMFYW